MCEFCEESKYGRTILTYDNYNAMDISYGQYRGVSVCSSLSMNGNMLILDGSGSYRSESDCYYDSWGVDTDTKRSRKDKSQYINIKYCPFCGKEIKSTLYEKTAAKDEISKLKNKLSDLENDLKNSNMFIGFKWTIGIRTKEEVDKLVQEKREECNKTGARFYEGSYREQVSYYDYKKYDFDNPLTLKQIKKDYYNLTASILYGLSSDNKYNKLEKLPDKYTLNTRIKCGSYFRPEFHSYTYLLTDEMYEKMAELGYIKKNDKKYSAMKKHQEKIKKEIEKVNNKINELEKYISSLEKAA